MNMVPVDKLKQLHSDNGEDETTGDPLQRVLRVNQRFFRDAMGRVLKRKGAERQKFAESAFLPPVLSVVECLLWPAQEILKGYAAVCGGARR